MIVCLREAADKVAATEGKASIDLPPAVEHLWCWFTDLCRTRGVIMVAAGPAGMAAQPAPLTSQEILSWAVLNDTRPTPWEVRALAAMDAAYLARLLKKTGSGTKHQGLGEYCNGEHLEECRKTFGAQLERVCATCPD